MSAPYTAIGSLLHRWKPLRALMHAPDDLLGNAAKHLWLQLYTIPEAKSGLPGLLAVSINGIAEATGNAPELVRSLLDRLIEHELIEYDIAESVLRFTQLPDTLEYPHNANVIKGWWRRYRNIPNCPIKAAHVVTLRWLLDERTRETGKAPPEWLVSSWADTFGTISVPAPRRRGVRRLQMNLFPESSDSGPEPSGNGSAVMDEGRSVTKIASDPKPKEIKVRETVSEPFPNGPEQDRDQVSVSSSGSGGGSGEGHDTGNASSSRPHLALVPESTPYGPEALLRTLERDSHGNFVGHHTDALLPALRDVVAQLCAHGVTLADLALLSSWLGRGLEVAGRDGQRYLGAWWAAKPNCVLYAVQRARIAQQDADAEAAEAKRRSDELRKTLSEGPYNLHL